MSNRIIEDDIDPRNRETVYFDPLAREPSKLMRLKELPRIMLDEVDLEKAIIIRIELPKSIFTHQGTSDPNHGRLVNIHDGSFASRTAIYMEYLGKQHRLLLLDTIKPYEPHIDTLINLKGHYFWVKNDGGGWSLLDELIAANEGAKDRALNVIADQTEVTETLSCPSGPRVVNVKNGISIHTGWTGESGLFNPYRSTEMANPVEQAMEDLALAMARTGTPFISHGMKTKIERRAAQLAPGIHGLWINDEGADQTVIHAEGAYLLVDPPDEF